MLPSRTASGKVQKFKLRDLAGHRLLTVMTVRRLSVQHTLTGRRR